MGEAGALGDLIEGEVGCKQQTLDIAEPQAEDFILGGAAESGLHPAFQGAAGGVESKTEIVHGEALVAALADEAGGAGHEWVGDDEVVGGLAGDDLARGDQDGRLGLERRRGAVAGFGSSAHEVGEQASGLVADAGAIKLNGGEGRGGEGAEGLVIFTADDRNFLGHSEAGAEAGIEEVNAELIVGGEDAHGLRQSAELGDETILAGFPIGGAVRGGTGEAGAGMPALLEAGDEVFDALDEEGLGIETIHSEVAVAAIEEVLGDGLADEAVVHSDEGSPVREGGGAEFHSGQTGGRDGAVEGRGKGAGKDAVALPVFEPGRRRGVGGAKFDEGGPGSLLSDVAADARENAPGVGAGSLDEEGDAGDHGVKVGISEVGAVRD